MPTPRATTATRSGSRVRVVRTDDVLPGHEPIVAVMSDGADVLAFTPTTAMTLAAMIARACATGVTLDITIENAYPRLDRSFTHHERVTVPPPHDGTDLRDWALEHLMPFTGEGPEYSRTTGVYTVVVDAAESDWSHLAGMSVTAEG